jgi:hypothetical protein
MVTITDDKLIIEITHPCPDELLVSLKDAIIIGLQHINLSDTDFEKIQHAQYMLLELLKNILEK